MPEKPKEIVEDPGCPSDEKKEKRAINDVAERPYYYDDAHGYQEFDPDSDEDTENE